MKPRQTLLTDEQWKLIEPLFPQSRRVQTSGVDRRQPIGLFRGHPVDLANRCGMAVSTGCISVALDLLAIAAMAGGRRLAAYLVRAAGRTGEEGLLRWDETSEEVSQIFGNAYPFYRERARGVQNTSSDFTKDSISFWCLGKPTTGML